MYLESIYVKNFRCHQEFFFTPHQKGTLLTGPNGAGKTSLLEAVFLASRAKSFLPVRSQDMIRRAQQAGRIDAIFRQKNGFTQKVSVELHSKGRKIFLNEKVLTRRRELLELFPSIIFSPQDRILLEGEGSSRRSFFDQLIGNMYLEYEEVLTAMKRSLQQRNEILKRKEDLAIKSTCPELVLWTKDFIERAKKLMEFRMQWVATMRDPLEKRYQDLAQKKDRLELVYECAKKEIPYCPYSFCAQEYGVFLEEELARNTQLDCLRGVTSVGPHRDSFSFLLEGKTMKLCASQGEKRTLYIAMRLEELSLLRRHRKSNPILLLDDVSSELDDGRRKALLDCLTQYPEQQAIITATHLPNHVWSDSVIELHQRISHKESQRDVPLG